MIKLWTMLKKRLFYYLSHHLKIKASEIKLEVFQQRAILKSFLVININDEQGLSMNYFQS